MYTKIVGNNDWIKMTDSQNNFSVELPYSPELLNRETQSGWVTLSNSPTQLIADSESENTPNDIYYKIDIDISPNDGSKSIKSWYDNYHNRPEGFVNNDFLKMLKVNGVEVLEAVGQEAGTEGLLSEYYVLAGPNKEKVLHISMASNSPIVNGKLTKTDPNSPAGQVMKRVVNSIRVYQDFATSN